MRVTKIDAMTQLGLNIAYSEKSSSGKWDKRSLDSDEKARPEFYETLSCIKPLFLEAMEFNTKEEDKKIVVTGIAYEYEGEGDDPKISVIIHGARRLKKWSHYVKFKTFKIVLGDYSKEHKLSKVLDGPQVSLLKSMIDEAEKFIKGERAQQKVL